MCFTKIVGHWFISANQEFFMSLNSLFHEDDSLDYEETLVTVELCEPTLTIEGTFEVLLLKYDPSMSIPELKKQIIKNATVFKKIFGIQEFSLYVDETLCSDSKKIGFYFDKSVVTPVVVVKTHFFSVFGGVLGLFFWVLNFIFLNLALFLLPLICQSKIGSFNISLYLILNLGVGDCLFTSWYQHLLISICYFFHLIFLPCLAYCLSLLFSFYFKNQRICFGLCEKNCCKINLLVFQF